ncbi:hypothetical protein TELCIR_03852 [Teladorsagia circumcincta]|uniref:Uncharacterized protein n=1 Tax=Teladorsagia circumcincta TaxID=45464 RepID=A0A2G9UV59_TELCI|nr:hypothetical protein TELCIR_03852 [Teladorsagia circumcincta]
MATGDYLLVSDQHHHLFPTDRIRRKLPPIWLRVWGELDDQNQGLQWPKRVMRIRRPNQNDVVDPVEFHHVSRQRKNR